MDGFDDNTGVVVMAATNRPGSLDAALTRPGRFDRMIVLPLPDVTGRAAILRVHARGKRVEEGVDYDRVARTTAGFTGAMLMSLMNGAALVAVRRGASSIAEADIMQALEDAFYTRTGTDGRKVDSDDVLAPRTRRAVAVYEAGRALVGSLLPQYEELAKVVCCPGGAPTGYAHFVPLEEHLETGVMTRGYLESLLVARMAGRAAERLVLGEGGVSTASAGDVLAATSVARELVLRAGLGRSLGPLSIMDTEAVYGRAHAARSVADLGTATAAAAAAEVEALVCAAEAKATAGIAANWGAFKALTEALLEREEMSGAEVRAELARAGAKPFADPCSDGYAWAGGSALLMTDGADASSSVTATADALARHALNADGAPDLATRRATRVNPFFSPAGTALPRFGGPGVDGAAGLPRLAGLPSDEQGDE
jgi:cell division protease FtsH